MPSLDSMQAAERRGARRAPTRLAAAALAAGTLALACSWSAAAGASAIAVTTAADTTTAGDGLCSLREALAAASGTASSDCPGAASSGQTVINLPAGTYHLTPGSELLIAGTVSVSLRGPTSDPTLVVIDGDDDATHRGRVLHIFGLGNVALSGLTITGGYTADGGAGANGSNSAGATGGTGFDGGGIFNVAATLTLDHVAVTGNRTGDGGPGGTGADMPGGAGFPGGDGGFAGYGAGVDNAGGTVTITNSAITANATGAGGHGGAGGSGLTRGHGGAGGHGGDGAGIENTSAGPLTITAVTIAHNSAGAGGVGGSGLSAAGGTGGEGGGISNSGTLTVSASTVADNTAGVGGEGSTGLAGGAGGSGGAGGAIFDIGNASLTDVTIAGNSAGAGGRGADGGVGGAGGPAGGGGGIEYGNPGTMSLLADTLTQNALGTPGAGGQGSGAGGPAGASAAGGGIEDAGTQLTETSSLIATNSRPNCAGVPTNGGHNLDFPAFDPSCPGANGDPRLSPLASNGGPTQTTALQNGSAAIDQVPAGAACPVNDQRGVARPHPSGGMCDIGAYEYAPPGCTAVSAATTAATAVLIQLSCADPAGVAVTYALDAAPAHGSLQQLDPAAGSVVFLPASGYSGADTFSYHGTDVNGTAAKETVTVSVASSSTTEAPPLLSHLRISPHSFLRPAAARRAKRPAATISWQDSEAATTTLTVQARRAGIKSAKGCVKRPRQRPAHARSCMRFVTVGSLHHTDAAGANKLLFTGVLAGARLPAGHYRMQVTPALFGRHGSTLTVSFRIKPRPKRRAPVR